ncbi:hypothetical protein GQ600_18589 [Phytophthora cactorum]|nr:hypothetical protein GQ600_18589 [Phytophthora cactorum]
MDRVAHERLPFPFRPNANMIAPGSMLRIVGASTKVSAQAIASYRNDPDSSVDNLRRVLFSKECGEALAKLEKVERKGIDQSDYEGLATARTSSVPSFRKTSKKKKSETSRKRLKAPADSGSEGRDEIAANWSEGRLEEVYNRSELQSVLSKNSVMKGLQPQVFGSLMGNVTPPPVMMNKLDTAKATLNHDEQRHCQQQDDHVVAAELAVCTNNLTRCLGLLLHCHFRVADLHTHLLQHNVLRNDFFVRGFGCVVEALDARVDRIQLSFLYSADPTISLAI